MTRVNVYAGPAGFFIIRGGPSGDNTLLDSRTGQRPAKLPGPAPQDNDQFPPKKPYYEIPIAIQDRSFNTDGSLFYPNSREFFDNNPGPYIPGSEISPIWNPEFFGNMIMVNGNTWPYQTVEKRRYRLRFLNGCQARFLILDFSDIPSVDVWMIGNEGGFLTAPVRRTAASIYPNQLLMAPAERADVIVDFTNVPVGNYILKNVGPDEPFPGGFPLNAADPKSTGQIMQFRVIKRVGTDPSTPPQFLKLPAITPLPAATDTRRLALLEELSEGAPAAVLLGTVAGDPNSATPGEWTKKLWADDVTENPPLGATEIWEIYNGTPDAHPMHVHEVAFEVFNRQTIIVDPDGKTFQVVPNSKPIPPAPWETGVKDTVIAYPMQVTRIKATFSTAGQYVWHCHIVEHEDNEMMRAYRIGEVQPGQPTKT